MSTQPNEALKVSQTSNEVDFSILRKKSTAVEKLQAALDAIDLESAEAQVDELEGERRRLLLSGSSEQAIDVIDGKIKAANRFCERLAAARDQIPGLIRTRQANDRAADARVKKAEVIRIEAIEALVLIDANARLVANLIEIVRAAESEISATNYDLRDLGRPAMASALGLLAEHLQKCRLAQLPPFLEWNLKGCHDGGERRLSAGTDLVRQLRKGTKSTPNKQDLD